jgi:transposase-like protein
MNVQIVLSKPSSYTDEVKREAILAYLTGEYTREQICLMFNVKCISTFKDWMREYRLKKQRAIINTKDDAMTSKNKKRPKGKKFARLDIETLSIDELKKAVRQIEFERDCQETMVEVLKKELS